MAKPLRKQKQKNFEKEYTKVMKDFKNISFDQNNKQQWSSPGDFFVKFSMYKETSSGITSSNTLFVSNP